MNTAWMKEMQTETTVMNYSIYKLYIQTFLLLQKHGGLIMKSQIYYTINIPHHIKLNECIFSFYCIKMFTF